jgi:hypothetical protein
MSKWACRASPTRARLGTARQWRAQARKWRAQARHASVTGRARLARGPKSLPRHDTSNANRVGPGWHVGPNPCLGTTRLMLIGPDRAGGTVSPLVQCRAQAQLHNTHNSSKLTENKANRL